MTRLWIKEIVRHRISSQCEMPCAPGEERDALSQALINMDLPQPMWLDKHIREYEKFRRTSFAPDHFVEPVKFDKIEIEFIDEEKKKNVRRESAGRFWDE